MRTPREICLDIHAILDDCSLQRASHAAEVLDPIRVLQRLLYRHAVLIFNRKSILGDAEQPVNRHSRVTLAEQTH